MTHKTIKAGEGFAIGVAVADHPLGPWRDAIGQALITDNTPNSITLNIDPCVVIDNGTPYLYWGSWGACRYVKLKGNMTEMDGPVQNVNARNFLKPLDSQEKQYLLSVLCCRVPINNRILYEQQYYRTMDLSRGDKRQAGELRNQPSGNN